MNDHSPILHKFPLPSAVHWLPLPLYLLLSHQCVLFCFLEDSHSDMGEMESHYTFSFLFVVVLFYFSWIQLWASQKPGKEGNSRQRHKSLGSLQEWTIFIFIALFTYCLTGARNPMANRPWANHTCVPLIWVLPLTPLLCTRSIPPRLYFVPEVFHSHGTTSGSEFVSKKGIPDHLNPTVLICTSTHMAKDVEYFCVFGGSNFYFFVYWLTHLLLWLVVLWGFDIFELFM